MKKSLLRTALIFIALLLSASFSFAADFKSRPDCPKSTRPHNCFGKFEWGNGTKYTGDWQNAKMDGHGIMDYANGDRYVGNWENGKKQGNGRYSYDNGDICFGVYQDDLLNGEATCTFADGDILKGIWKNNKFTGL
jgi:hypothetical protein